MLDGLRARGAHEAGSGETSCCDTGRGGGADIVGVVAAAAAAGPGGTPPAATGGGKGDGVDDAEANGSLGEADAECAAGIGAGTTEDDGAGEAAGLAPFKPKLSAAADATGLNMLVLPPPEAFLLEGDVGLDIHREPGMGRKGDVAPRGFVGDFWRRDLRTPKTHCETLNDRATAAQLSELLGEFLVSVKLTFC